MHLYKKENKNFFALILKLHLDLLIILTFRTAKVLFKKIMNFTCIEKVGLKFNYFVGMGGPEHQP